jgi:hypothetical protein
MDGGLQIGWQALGALTGALTTAGILQSLYLKLTIKSSIADLTKELDGRYPGVKLCDERHRALDHRLEGLEEGHCAPNTESKELS